MIGVAGYGYTGSSAVFEYLQEFQSLNYVKHEFSLIFRPDGFEDLNYHLNTNPRRFLSSKYALPRFILLNLSFFKIYIRNKLIREKAINLLWEYIDSITQMKWKSPIIGFSASNINGWQKTSAVLRMTNWFYKNLSRFSNNLPDFRCKEEIFFSILPSDFMILSKRYLNELIDLIKINNNSNEIVIDQVVSADSPNSLFDYFDNAKLIIVDRDPRDLFIQCKELKKDIGFIPSKNVEDFIQYYRLLRGRGKNENQTNESNILRIYFEDFVLNFENVTKKISQFIGHQRPKHNKIIFNVSESHKNVNVYPNYPKYKEEINLIENELAGYLYNHNGLVHA